MQNIILKTHIEENQDIWLVEDFPDMILEAQSIKRKNDKLDYTETIALWKPLLKNEKLGESIYESHKGLESIIYKESSKFSIKKVVRKWAKILHWRGYPGDK